MAKIHDLQDGSTVAYFLPDGEMTDDTEAAVKAIVLYPDGGMAYVAKDTETKPEDKRTEPKDKHVRIDTTKYNEDEPRDDHGRWTDGGGDGADGKPGAGDNKPGVGGPVSSPGVPASLVKAIEDHLGGIGGVQGEHGAADLTHWLALTQKSAMLDTIDKGALAGRPAILLHKGDLEKGVPSVWLLGWNGRQGTDIHDHLSSQVGISVVRGTVENKFSVPHGDYIEQAKSGKGVVAPTVTQFIRAGSTMSIPAPYIHEMKGTARAGLTHDVTVHAYYPPLDRMHYFTRDKAGKLHYDGEWDADRPASEYSHRKSHDGTELCGCASIPAILAEVRNG